MELAIVEGVCTHRGVRIHEVVEKDDWKYTSHGFFHSIEEAEKYIADFKARYLAKEK